MRYNHLYVDPERIQRSRLSNKNQFESLHVIPIQGYSGQREAIT